MSEQSPPDPDSIRTRQDFARELTHLRERAGLSVRDVVAALPRQGRRHGTIGDWFAGRGLPQPSSHTLFEQVLRACGVTDDDVSRWLTALRRVRRTRTSRLGEEPYRGLNRFDADHAGWFFGRERLTDQLVERVRSLRQAGGGILLVTGASGIGKSSVLRAGLIPTISATTDGDAAPPETVVLTPGTRPLKAWQERATGVDIGRAPVIVVDQFEEVFAPGVDATESDAFVAALVTATQRRAESAATGRGAGTEQPGAVVVLGLRADFYADLLRIPALAMVAQEHQLTVGPMTAAELRRAITEPARRAGVDIEDGLVDLLLREIAPRSGDQSAAHDPGALPLLSHALLATWESGGGRLTAERYRATGGIDGAVAATADAVYSRLSPRHQALTRTLFLRLVHLGHGTANTRRRLRRAHLLQGTPSGTTSEDIDEVIDRFVDRRLLTVDDDTVEISHEALLIAWPHLRGWLTTDRAGLLIGQQVTDAAEVWITERRDPALLLRGSRLVAGQQWLAGHPAPPALPARFLRASTRHARRRLRRLYQTVAALTVLTLVSTVAGVIAVRRTSEAVSLQHEVAHQRDEARSRLIAGRAEQLRDKDVSLSRQLALVAHRIAPTTEARSSLISSSATLPAIRMLTGKNQTMYTVALSPDGRLLAAAVDTTIRLWDVVSGPRPVPLGDPLTGPTGPGYSITFSPDGRTLAVGSGDHRVHRWDLSDSANPVQLPPLVDAGNTVYSVAYRPDGRVLAAASADGTARLYDTTDRAHPTLIGAGLASPSGAKSLTFHPGGRILAVGGVDGTIRLWDVARPHLPGRLSQPAGPSKEVGQVAFSPDGRTLAAGSTDFTTHIWDVSHPARPVRLGPALTGPKSFVNAVAFSPDSSLLGVGSSDPAIGVQIYDLASRRITATLPHPAPVTAVHFSPDGRAVVTSSNDGTARLWPLPGPVLATPGVVSATLFSPDGRTLAVGSTSTQLWNVEHSDRPTPVGPALSNPDGFSGALAFTPDNRTLAVSARSGRVQLWDVSEPTRPVRHGPTLQAHDQLVETVAISPDGRILATGSRDHTVRLWNITHRAAPTPLATLRGFGNYVSSVAFNHDASLLAAGSIDRSVRLWDTSRPDAPVPLGEPLTAGHYVYAVAFSPDRRILAIGSADSSISLYDVSRPHRPVPVGAPLTGPTNYVYALAFNPEGTALAAAGTSAGTWLWDLRDRSRPSVFAVLPAPGGGTYAVAFHRNGHTLGAGGTGNTVWLWNTNPDLIPEQLCAAVGDDITPAEWATYVPGPPYEPPCPDQ
ncbi:putative cytosolic iron-sulfur protein assembly protein CIAO1 like protein [Micromonospora saelicesensis]|uniref:Cytosolic iron-sulfur protein assembly protein CIAO1 like protein n=1 Tax=Micromonospora saelicesensis TaxID=285676 RepID=A0ABX9CGX1_9ACTN|nr:helix-turn-helix domain-containing protein [Micromonospora saelicesensis]RAN97438.1 putative cytosolic iron-sulfur protein assembly protein CIAO1 like protein [Micromonospora saelicesensis]